ncbi:hypothetical protein [Burkholderia sp. Bp9140]|uniref:hypothetical protein n=1 Tax=Burkholderia sp. Bp9140 TaxID=2184572 RepID=UPI000F55CCBF|nr:hypothetical protein [Burkholderia sp. Bp9140]
MYINSCRAALGKYLTADRSGNRLVDHAGPVLVSLGRARNAVQIVRGGGSRLGKRILAESKQARVDASNQATDSPGRPGLSTSREHSLLRRFNHELGVFRDGCGSVLEAVGKMMDVHRSLALHIEARDGTATFRATRSDLNRLASIATGLDENMASIRAAFDRLFEYMGRDMPALRNATIGGRAVNLEASWKATLRDAVAAHVSDLLVTQGFVNAVHEVPLQASFVELEGNFGGLWDEMRDAAGPGERYRMMNEEEVRKQEALLSRLKHVGGQYDNFSRRMDDGLRWIDALRGKPGVNDIFVLVERCRLLDMSIRVDILAIGSFEHARNLRSSFDLNSGTHDPAALDAFNEVSRNMGKRVAELHYNVTHCIAKFPNGEKKVYLDPEDALRQPVLDAVAHHCDDIETDLAWLRNGAQDPKTGLVNVAGVEGAFDRLQGAVSRIRRDLQWNIAIAAEMKALIDTPASGRSPMCVAPLDPAHEKVSQYVNKHLKGLEMPAAEKMAVPDIDWGDAPKPQLATTTVRSGLTRRQRMARAEMAQNQRTRQEADERRIEEQRRKATESLAAACAEPFHVDDVRQHADALAAQARTEEQANGLHLLSGSGVYGKFMRAVNALDAGRRHALGRIATIDRLVAELIDLEPGKQAIDNAKNSALPAREALSEHAGRLSKEMEALRHEAAVQQKRRVLKQFAQNPTRESFLWLQKHDGLSLVSARKTVDRLKLSSIAPNGVSRSHDDFFDEYVIELRDQQAITYLVPGTGEQRTENVTTVPLHVHYRSADATRPEACHFKNAAQRTFGGSGVYRSDDSVALMAGILASVSAMARGL